MENMMDHNSHCRWSSRRIFRRFTVIELVVVLSIMGVLMATISHSLLKVKNKIASKDSKMTLTTGDFLADTDLMPEGEMQDEKASDSSTSTSTAKTSSGEVKKGRRAPGSMIDLPETPRQEEISVAETKKKKFFSRKKAKKVVVVSKKETLEDLLPEPVAIEPKNVKITVIDAKEREIEPFARYFFAKGSENTSIENYTSWWKSKLDNKERLNAGWRQKRDSGSKISRFNYYMRRSAVFKSSPYRSFLLRRKILRSYLNPFDEKTTVLMLKARATREFTLCVRGEKVTIEVDGTKYSGTFSDSSNGTLLIGEKKFHIEELPENIRWKFDKDLLAEKRQGFLETELKKEKMLFEQKQQDRINAILQAEFPMLKDDPLLFPKLSGFKELMSWSLLQAGDDSGI